MPIKRETIEPKEGSNRFVRRNRQGEFTPDQTEVEIARCGSQTTREDSNYAAEQNKFWHSAN
jgi:hypothetical protein